VFSSTPASNESLGNMTVTRRKQLSETASADAKSHRGNNWDEDDSVLIVKAYRYAEEKIVQNTDRCDEMYCKQ
jgi:hypothetical protein